MSSQRVALIAAVFAAVAISLAAAKQNDLIIGKRVAGDSLVQREFIQKDGSIIGKTVTITKTLLGDGDSTITQIRALDQNTNDHGATAQLIAGGVGYSYVTMRFESENFRAIKFIVEIYGSKAFDLSKAQLKRTNIITPYNNTI